MPTTTKSLLSLTAGDLMSHQVIVLTQEMSLREAARRLLEHQIGGAPVVDAWGKCVGVLSAADFVRLAEKGDETTHAAAFLLPVTCSYQEKHRGADGREKTLCTLSAGVCPVQVKEAGPDGHEMLVCSQPHAVLADWQVVDVEQLPAGEVGRYMTADPVTVLVDTPIRSLARQMIDAHIHRVIVVDAGERPVGVVSSTDILSAVAYAENLGFSERY